MGEANPIAMQFRVLLENLDNKVQEARIAHPQAEDVGAPDKFEILKNAIVMIATTPEAHAGAHAVPDLQEAIQRYYNEIAEEEPPHIDLSVYEQVAFDAIRNHVKDNLNWFRPANI